MLPVNHKSCRMTFACTVCCCLPIRNLLAGSGVVACPHAASPNDLVARLRKLLALEVRAPSGNCHRRHGPCGKTLRFLPDIEPAAGPEP